MSTSNDTTNETIGAPCAVIGCAALAAAPGEYCPVHRDADYRAKWAAKWAKRYPGGQYLGLTTTAA